jgi:hypothetical protein
MRLRSLGDDGANTVGHCLGETVAMQIQTVNASANRWLRCPEQIYRAGVQCRMGANDMDLL